MTYSASINTANVSATIHLVADQAQRLGSKGATDASNFKAPTAVYISVPIISLFLGLCSVGAYLVWKKDLQKNREQKLEKVARKRRRASLKPGSANGQKAQKFGLERDQKLEHVISINLNGKFHMEAIEIASRLEDMEKIIFDFQSLECGASISENQDFSVDGKRYNVTINPLYSSLQSGACGYIISGLTANNSMLRLVNALEAQRRRSSALRLEDAFLRTSSSESSDLSSLYSATAPTLESQSSEALVNIDSSPRDDVSDNQIEPAGLKSQSRPRFPHDLKSSKTNSSAPSESSRNVSPISNNAEILTSMQESAIFDKPVSSALMEENLSLASRTSSGEDNKTTIYTEADTRSAPQAVLTSSSPSSELSTDPSNTPLESPTVDPKSSSSEFEASTSPEAANLRLNRSKLDDLSVTNSSTPTHLKSASIEGSRPFQGSTTKTTTLDPPHVDTNPINPNIAIGGSALDTITGSKDLQILDESQGESSSNSPKNQLK